MYINKTSRRIIFLNAAFLAVIVLFVVKNFFNTSGLFNMIAPVYVFSASVIVESLRYLKNKKKLRKMFKIIKGDTCFTNKLKPCRELLSDMEEIGETDRM